MGARVVDALVCARELVARSWASLEDMSARAWPWALISLLAVGLLAASSVGRDPRAPDRDPFAVEPVAERRDGTPSQLVMGALIAAFCVVALLMGCLYVRLWSRP